MRLAESPNNSAETRALRCPAQDDEETAAAHLELAVDVGPCPGSLERDDISSNRHPALSFCSSMISGQTLRVCPEGKPVPTHRAVARGHAFPDHALASRTSRRYGQSDCR